MAVLFVTALLTVVIQNTASIPDATLDSVKAEVERIFDSADITLVWAKAIEPGRFEINIVLRRQPGSGPGANAHSALGTTLGGDHARGGTSFVFYERVLKYAHEHNRSVAVILAYAIAHELGHVWLPAPAHASSGLMKAQWNDDDIRHLDTNRGTFTPDQVAVMSAAIDGRSGATGSLPSAHAASQAIVVPFERAPSPYVVIRVPVAGGSCEALIFDTGTNTTVLAPSLAARVGLSNGPATSLESLNGSVPAIEGEVRGIGFDGIPAGAPRLAIAADISGLRRFGTTVAGLYGHNWLVGTDYLIDYGAKCIVMGSAGRLPSPPGGLRAPLTWAAGRPVVTAMVRAHAVEAFPGRFVLDSGADHVTVFGRAADRLALVPNRETRVIDSGLARVKCRRPRSSWRSVAGVGRCR